jgi:ABC-2 type transport system permease protein
LLLGMLVVTIAVSAVAAAATSCPGQGCAVDPTQISLSGVLVAQLIVAVLGVQAIGGEYSSGVIVTSLVAVPRRVRVLVAKAALVAGPVLAVSTVAVLGSAAVAGSLLTAAGFTPEQGYPVVALTAGSTVRAVAGSALYLTLIALLALGVATLVRSSAAAIGLVLGLLFVFPLLAAVVTDPDWQRHLRQLAPTAGLAVQASVDLDSLPIGPWPGLGVTALWAAGALAAGGVALCRRDA